MGVVGVLVYVAGVKQRKRNRKTPINDSLAPESVDPCS